MQNMMCKMIDKLKQSNERDYIGEVQKSNEFVKESIYVNYYGKISWYRK